MSIETIYRSLLLDAYIKSQLATGEPITKDTISYYLESTLADINLTVPQFDVSSFLVADKEESSASKMNSTFDTVKTDLRVLYKGVLELNKASIEDFERWKLEVALLEKRLIDLENRIDNLLLAAQDTEGYHSFFFENFSDLEYVDLDLTTVLVDTASQQAYLSPALSTNQKTTRVFLNSLKDKDALFKVRSTKGFISRNDLENSQLKNVFHQKSKAWWTSIKMNRLAPVTCELTVKLSTESIDLSSIYLEVHDSIQSGALIVTPLYSTDNYNFSQLPTVSYSQEVRKSAVFNFETINVQYVKFLLVKDAPDESLSDSFSYQFGFKEIGFYKESFDTESTYQLVSKPISVVDINNNPVEFDRVALEVCERLEGDTSIRYFVTPSNVSSVSVDDNTNWYPIAPLSRKQPLDVKVLSFADLIENEVGVSESVGISYDGTVTDTDYNNPAQTFHLLSKESDDTILDESVVATAVRYIFANTEDRILDYQIKDTDYSGSGTGTALEMNEDSLVIFRNVGAQGLIETDSVRGVQRGWRFEEPYYITIVEVQNPQGMSIDFGDKHVIIDGVKYTNKVGPSILAGKDEVNTGLHEIKIHKTNWKHVTPDLDVLYGTSGLVAADPLYPYNHKLLVEGYAYGDNYSNDLERVYNGVDFFAAYRMKRISFFDFNRNIKKTDYKYFALDQDAGTAHTGGNNPTRVVVIKVNEENPDAINEKFVLRFKTFNQTYQYFRFKAEFQTTNELITPSLDSYKLKFGV